MAAELFLTPLVEVTVSKVISAATEQLNLMVGYEEELGNFLKTLGMIRGVLLDAEEKKATSNQGVMAWLQQLRGVVEEADALVDEISYEALRQKAVQKQKLKQVSNLFTSSNPLAVRRRMASKINKLNAALDKLNSRASGLGLQNMLANQMVPYHQGSVQQTNSLLGDPSEIKGRKGDTEEIVRLLVESSNDQLLGVVSIVGVGGLGKTTLAKLVCEDEQIQNHFFKKIWVCVSEKFDVRSILVQMLESLTKDSCSSITNQDTIVSKIKDVLQDKNYLLVLDDVWNEDEEKWKSLRNYLLGITKNVRGSKVLVTTRLPTVASMMGSLPGRIELLKDDDCWSIIKHRAFNDSLVPLELEEIGKKIASKCRGMPLVANVVGGTLGKNKNEDHWLSIEKDFDVCGPLVNNDRVLQMLKSSFDRLPSFALKQCFAFCSTFQKDFVMEREMLVQVWMANGFLQQPHGSHKEMEDVGEEYFMELVSCSFLQDVKKDFYRRIVSCKMHDLMHDLAKSISKSETLVVEDKGTSDIHGVRHLNLICAPSMGPTQTVKVIQEVYSLFSKVDIFNGTPVKFKRLLSLSFSGAGISELPGTLGGLKRLRYLDISETKVKVIPRFISKLYSLQTLRLLKCRFIETPLVGIENLANLKHIHFDDVKLMPARIGNLSCLQTLPLFAVKHEEGHRIEELGQLNQLRGNLQICHLGLVYDKAEATKAKLCEKAAVTSLVLEFDSEGAGDRDDDDDVLEGLRPHSNLKGLTLEGYRGKSYPRWMLESTGNLGEPTCLRNLMRLEFFCCDRLECIPLLSLSNLMEMYVGSCGELETIELLSLNKEGALTIRGCGSLKKIAVSSLKSLSIQYCDELVGVHIGSNAAASLKEISICGCNKLESLPMISELSFLESLFLSHCENLRYIGDGGTSFASMCLVKLILEDCPNLVSMPSLEGKASTLQTLRIGHPQQLESIKWDNFSSSTCLKHLAIDGCDDLMHLPNLSSLLSLQTVEICDCRQLKSIEPLYAKELSIRSCPALTSFILDGSLSYSTCLKKLSVWDCLVLMVFPNLHGFTSLEQLSILRCGIRRLPDGLESLLHLSELSLGHFSEELEEFPDLSPIQPLDSSLEELCLYGWEKLKHLPHQIQHLTALRDLEIYNFTGLEVLPDWLGNLSSLQNLQIRDCTSLVYDPFVEALHSLSNLKSLEISGCPQLEERYSREYGAKQDKLSHIPKIRLTGYKDPREGTTPTELEVRYARESGIKQQLDKLSRIPKIILNNFTSPRRATTPIEESKKLVVTPTIDDEQESTKLVLDFSSEIYNSQDHDTILEGLRPHSNLKELILEVYAGRSCPSWMLESNSDIVSTYLSNLLLMAFLGCYHLKIIPSLSLSSLVSLKIFGCDELESIGPLSLSSAARLEILNCRVLTNVAVSSIQDLIIEDCHELVSIHLGPQVMGSLNEIDIQRCNKLESLPMIDRLSSLQILRIRECCKLISIGDRSYSFVSTCLKEVTLTNCVDLQSMPILDGMSSLQKLVIRGCDNLVSGGVGKSAMASLKELNIKKTCFNMDILSMVSDWPCLEILHLEDCQKLGVLKNIGYFAFSKLVKLTLHRCDNVLISNFEGLYSIETIVIKHCQQLKSIWGDLSSSAHLKSLTIWDCPALTSIPSLHGLTSLQKLCIVHCGLSELPSGLSSLLHLSRLELGGFSEELEEFPDLGFIQHLYVSLTVLTLVGWEKLRHLPHQIQHLTALKELEVRNFGELEDLPDWFGNLSSLQTLELKECNSLMHMPSVEATQLIFSSLKRLVIHSCPKLTVSCARESGSEWHKISHIPYIAIEGRVIQRIEASRENGLTIAAAEQGRQLATRSRSFLGRLRNRT